MPEGGGVYRSTLILLGALIPVLTLEEYISKQNRRIAAETEASGNFGQPHRNVLWSRRLAFADACGLEKSAAGQAGSRRAVVGKGQPERASKRAVGEERCRCLLRPPAPIIRARQPVGLRPPPTTLGVSAPPMQPGCKSNATRMRPRARCGRGLFRLGGTAGID